MPESNKESVDVEKQDTEAIDAKIGQLRGY